MTIEVNLERIAAALEALAAVARSAPGVPAAAEPARRSPGRPPKTTAAEPAAPAAAPVAAPVAEPDPFDLTPAEDPGAPLTREDVRSALVAYQKRFTPEKARKLLKDAGGVDTLGSLPEEKFSAVVAATKVS